MYLKRLDILKEMFHLSSSDQLTARANALGILTDNALKILGGKSSKRMDTERAAYALMAVDWTPELARRVGFRRLNRLLCRIRNDKEIFPTDEYLIFADMIAHATDEHTNPPKPVGALEGFNPALPPIRGDRNRTLGGLGG